MKPAPRADLISPDKAIDPAVENREACLRPTRRPAGTSGPGSAAEITSPSVNAPLSLWPCGSQPVPGCLHR